MKTKVEVLLETEKVIKKLNELFDNPEIAQDDKRDSAISIAAFAIFLGCHKDDVEQMIDMIKDEVVLIRRSSEEGKN
jgi:hypothetical protein